MLIFCSVALVKLFGTTGKPGSNPNRVSPGNETNDVNPDSSPNSSSETQQRDVEFNRDFSNDQPDSQYRNGQGQETGYNDEPLEIVNPDPSDSYA